MQKLKCKQSHSTRLCAWWGAPFLFFLHRRSFLAWTNTQLRFLWSWATTNRPTCCYNNWLLTMCGDELAARRPLISILSLPLLWPFIIPIPVIIPIPILPLWRPLIIPVPVVVAYTNSKFYASHMGTSIIIINLCCNHHPCGGLCRPYHHLCGCLYKMRHM